MNLNIFREYDIRGIVERDFPDSLVVDLGRAYATLLHRAGKREITLGRDCRLTSDHLNSLLLEGLLASGINVIDIGVVPTPLLYFSVRHWKMDGGAMITGSHNSAEYNGFKLGVGESTIFGEQIQELARIMERRAFAPAAGRGRVEKRPITPEYAAFIKHNFRFRRPLKVAVDGGNGCGGAVAAPLMRELGLETVELYIEMDGHFPHHHPDPTVEANMRDLTRAVVEHRTNLGIAYDGDADRIGAVDEQGRIIWGDELLVLFSRAILAEHPGATIIGEVKCSQRLYDDIARRGGRPIMWKTGHSLLKEKLRAENAALAGEMSGHMFFADRYYGFDDAVYASFRLLEILDRAGLSLSQLLADLPPSATTPEIRVDCPDDRKFEIARRLAEHFRARYPVSEIDGVRVKFEDGWGLARASNTQPALVLRFEGRDQAALTRIRALFEEQLSRQGAL
jgi:phosphomannomutase/phosphoglucomutase